MTLSASASDVLWLDCVASTEALYGGLAILKSRHHTHSLVFSDNLPPPYAHQLQAGMFSSAACHLFTSLSWPQLEGDDLLGTGPCPYKPQHTATCVFKNTKACEKPEDAHTCFGKVKCYGEGCPEMEGALCFQVGDSRGNLSDKA